MIKNLLLTGPSGGGKTSIIRKLTEVFKEFNPAGFYTVEVVEDGVKAGFLVFNLQGDSRILASPTLKSRYAVGKFRIDMKSFDSLLNEVFSPEKKTGLYFIDGIDKLVCQSRKFSKLIIELLAADKPVIASIPEKGIGIITEIKKREDVKLIEVTPENRDLRLKEITLALRDLLLE
ncbi:MAG: nucleoside-triphosphatase [Candidatus Sulfobium sp.]